VSAVRRARQGTSALVADLDHALGRVTRPLANLVPRRLRRIAERIEHRKTRPVGQIAAVGFLLAAILYGLIAGGQLGRLADSLLVFVGFGIETVEIAGHRETPELAILEKLEIGGSLLSFDVALAQARVSELPWVARATVRKFYPSTLSVQIEEREPFALWQRQGEVFVIDRDGGEIVELEESRHAALPFLVGERANLFAVEFLTTLYQQPTIAERTLASVLVAGRRWDVHLEDGVVVKLPEEGLAAALAQLVKLHAEQDLLARDVVVVDLRLPDRITVRLPEGRSLEDVLEEADPDSQART
jgi:cell division protein FtsQ